jgi:hypothetical protein
VNSSGANPEIRYKLKNCTPVLSAMSRNSILTDKLHTASEYSIQGAKRKIRISLLIEKLHRGAWRISEKSILIEKLRTSGGSEFRKSILTEKLHIWSDPSNFPQIFSFNLLRQNLLKTVLDNLVCVG